MRRFKSTRPCFATEAEMGEVVMKLLHEGGFTHLYPELQGTDLVGVRDIDDMVVAFELKLKMNTKVICQAERHKRYANGVAVIINQCNTGEQYWLRQICKEHGVGVYVVERSYTNPDGTIQGFNAPPTYQITEVEVPAMREANTQWYRKLMSKHAETHTTPGHKGPTSVTPFRATAYRLIDYVVAHPNCTIKEAVAAIPHHYASPYTATYRLKAITMSGGIPGLSVGYDNVLSYEEPRKGTNEAVQVVP